MSRALAEKRGRRAEVLAAWYLRLKGYKILAQRVKTHRGEIDLVAKRGRALVFVEVKARATLDAGTEILTPPALKRVKAAADLLTHRFGVFDSVRIDAIVLAPRHWPRHIENIGFDL
jgi:putative endonuclease